MHICFLNLNRLHYRWDLNYEHPSSRHIQLHHSGPTLTCSSSKDKEILMGVMNLSVVVVVLLNFPNVLLSDSWVIIGHYKLSFFLLKVYLYNSIENKFVNLLQCYSFVCYSNDCFLFNNANPWISEVFPCWVRHPFV